MARGSSRLAIVAIGIAIAITSAVLLTSSKASADPWRGLVFLEWTPAAAQSCPTEGELTEQVETAQSSLRHCAAANTPIAYSVRLVRE